MLQAFSLWKNELEFVERLLEDDIRSVNKTFFLVFFG